MKKLLSFIEELRTGVMQALQEKPLVKDGEINLDSFTIAPGGNYYTWYFSTNALSFIIEVALEVNKVYFRIESEDFSLKSAYSTDFFKNVDVPETVIVNAFFDEVRVKIENDYK